MKIGFKKSLFGFNCNEVIDYIKSSNQRFNDEKEKYQIAIDSLNKKIKSNEESIEFLSAQLETYIEKEAQINELAQKMSELYLTSKITAEEVLKNAEANKNQVNELVNMNLVSVSNANKELENIESELDNSVAEFNSLVRELKLNLENTKQDLAKRNKEIESFEEEFIKVKD